MTRMLVVLGDSAAVALAALVVLCSPAARAQATGFSASSDGGGRFDEPMCRSSPVLTCFLSPTQSNDASGQPSRVTGKIDFNPYFDSNTGTCRTRITGSITGLGSGPHGWHVHQKGDISDPRGVAAGDHYNPFNAPHGIPSVDQRTHEGDIGNLEPDGGGVANVNVDSAIRTRLVLGRGLIIHAARDQGATAQPSGNSGVRLAQCVLGRTDIDNIF